MVSDAAHTERAYAEHQGLLTQQRLLPSVGVIFVFAVIYGLADVILEDFNRADAWYYGGVAAAIGGALAWLLTRTPTSPERFILGLDVVLSLLVAGRLLSEETSPSGTALVLTLKTLALPLVLPWRPRFHVWAVAFAVLAYFVFVSVHANIYGVVVEVHQAVGLPLAGTLSLFGAWSIDRARWNAFIHRLRLEQSEERLQALLAEREADAQAASAVAQVAHAILDAVNTSGLLERLARESAAVLGADFVHVLLNDEATAAYHIAAAWGDPEEELEELRMLRLPHGQFVAAVGRLRREGLVQCGPDSDRPLMPPEVYRMFGVTHTMVVALDADRGVGGFLSAGFRGRWTPFSPLHERIFRGIGQLASLGLANARLFEELQQASRVKADFVASMSHELRTPLNVIFGYHELLANEDFGPLSDAQREVILRLQYNSRQLLELIGATLDLSRIDSGRVGVRREQVDVAQLLTALRREVEESHPEQARHFTWDVPQPLPAIVTDATKLRIIVRNLMANAVKFSAGKPVTVSVAVQVSDLEICVADQGIGIPVGVQALIFEPFRQADPTIAERFGGAGLGLHLARRLVEILGGSIAVESTPGSGATFRVRIPGAVPAVG